MKVKRLNGPLLNFWVAKSAGFTAFGERSAANAAHDHGPLPSPMFDPAHDWSQAGAIVASEWQAIEDMLLDWFGPDWARIPAVAAKPLEWFMRAYVATRFGDEVEDLCLPDMPAVEERDNGPAQADPSRVRRWFRRLVY